MAKKQKKEQKQLFTYEGTDSRGTQRKGEVSANSMALARAELRRQGIVAKKVAKKSNFSFGGKKKIKAGDVAIFTRQMATMMKAGVPLVQSFEIVADGLEHPAMRDVVLKIKEDVEAGGSFASALRSHPLLFDDLFCSLIDAGEQSGTLESMLDRVALYKEKSEALKSKIKSAVKYPITVLVVAAIVTAILLIKVVPTFQELFEGFGAELPAPTQLVVNLSESLRTNGWMYLIGIAVALYLFFYFKKRSKKFADWIDKVTLKLPIFGDITQKSTVARFARTLSTTFAAGVPLIDALDACAGATGNSLYRQAVYDIKDDVATGTQLQFAMRQSQIFPSLALQMTAIGEESGALDDMLAKVADHYEREVDDAVDGLTSMMEPMIMAFLGVVIGGLIIAMYLPIFQMGDVVG